MFIFPKPFTEINPWVPRVSSKLGELCSCILRSWSSCQPRFSALLPMHHSRQPSQVLEILVQGPQGALPPPPQRRNIWMHVCTHPYTNTPINVAGKGRGLEPLAASGSSCTLWLDFLESKYENGMENAHLGMPTALLPAVAVSLNSEQMG